MYIKRKRLYKRKRKGKGALLGSDWPRIRKTLQPFVNAIKKTLQKKKTPCKKAKKTKRKRSVAKF